MSQGESAPQKLFGSGVDGQAFPISRFFLGIPSPCL